jgi:hypothetical protein
VSVVIQRGASGVSAMVSDIEYAWVAWIAWLALYESSIHFLRVFSIQCLVDPVLLTWQ